ncbi:MAG: universal stress protein [Rhodobacteraceae bacterium]|nr:universal stress protein [Paracoccaceae bacterium]
MIGRILVAIDGSSHSQKAVEYSAEIAAGCKADLIILTVIKFHQTPKITEELRAYAELEQISVSTLDSMKLLSNDMLAAAERTARDKGVSKVKTVVETGPVARTIVSYADKNNVDIIAIGSRGLGNIEATLRGGVSHRVELLAKCAVLTVK